MAISIALGVQLSSNFNNQPSFVTASWTPTANRLLIASFTTTRTAAIPTPTIAGNSLTWAQVTDQEWDTVSKRYRTTTWVALSGATPATGTITVSVSSNCNGCNFVCDEVNGADISGTALAAIIQTKLGSVDAGAGDLTITLDSGVTTGNASYGVMCHETSAGTATAGSYTKVGEVADTTPGRMHTQYKAAGSTTVDCTWSDSAQPGGVAMEIAATPTLTIGTTLSKVTASLAADTPPTAQLTATLNKVVASLSAINTPNLHVETTLRKLTASLEAGTPSYAQLDATLEAVEASLSASNRNLRITTTTRKAVAALSTSITPGTRLAARLERVVSLLRLADPAAVDGPDAAALRITQLPEVYIAQPTWPGRMLTNLYSAYGVDYGWVQGDPRPGACSVKEDDPGMTRDNRQPGNRVVILWPPFDPWVGFLVTNEKAYQTGTMELAALDVLEILSGRVTPQDLEYTRPIASGLIVRYLLDVANEQDTGIRAGNIESGPTIEELALGGQSVMEAMREVCERTGYEFWVTNSVTPNHIDTLLHFGRRQGDDLRDKLHLYEGIHFNDARAKLDVSQVSQSRTMIGDFGMEVKDRRSVTRSSLVTGTSSSRARRVTSLLAGTSVADLPPGLRNEAVVIEVMSSNLAELDRRAEHEHEKMLEQQAQYNDVVVLPSLTDDQLNWIKVGNIWTRHGTFGDEVEDVVRIIGVQPNPEQGLVELASVAVIR